MNQLNELPKTVDVQKLQSELAQWERPDPRSYAAPGTGGS